MSIAKWVAANAPSLGERRAVALAHTSAIVWHAASWDLIDREATPELWLLGGLIQICMAHPELEELANPEVNPFDTVTPEISCELLEIWNTNDDVISEGTPNGHLLGDLYQHLSVEARKGRALCQTPPWVTHLLLEMTLRHLVEEAPHDGLPSMMDPSCGTGHILIETYLQMLRCQPDGPLPERAGAALTAVHGVDLDPYAAAVARYRLLAVTAALLECQLHELPAGISPRVGVANSLLDEHPLLERGQYDLIIANPPYITCKDKAENDAIRKRYPDVCHMKYSLALPFHALMHELLRPGGWCAQLTANSFMKREFGKKYIESYLPRFDLRWLIDTSGAYIPGHGTPTCILVTRNQSRESDVVRAVLGIKGEPSAPEDPSQGQVWLAIQNGVLAREAKDRAPGLATEPALLIPGQPTAVVDRPVQEALFDLIEVA